MITYMHSPSEVAHRFGLTRQAVSRVARKIGVGVIAGNRLVAIPTKDLKKLKDSLHSRPGKPSKKGGK